MQQDGILIKLILDRLGIDFSIETKEERIGIQKIVYLLQNAGKDLGYKYIWYINGPYCQKLNPVYYGLNRDIKCGDEEDKWYTLSNDFNEPLTIVKKIIDNIPETYKRHEWLELTDSILFLFKHYKDEQAVKEVLKSKKPQLMDSYLQAFNLLKELKILNN